MLVPCCIHHACLYCRWDVHGDTPQVEASYEAHSNWVNSIAVMEDVLVTCSSDTTVQFWEADTTGEITSKTWNRFVDCCTDIS